MSTISDKIKKKVVKTEKQRKGKEGGRNKKKEMFVK